MSRISRRLSSVIFVLAVAVVSYSLIGRVERVIAADNPPVNEARSPEAGLIEIPGAFKDLPDAKDAITSKRVEETKMTESAPMSVSDLAVDASKGVISRNEDRELLDFQATAYCLKGRTASGVYVRPGVIAADPRVLPLGTVVHLRAGRYTGTYTVLDTGGLIRGRLIDVYVPTHREAKEFGRRKVKLKVMGRARLASDPADKSPVVAELVLP